MKLILFGLGGAQDGFEEIEHKTSNSLLLAVTIGLGTLATHFCESLFLFVIPSCISAST
jgi:hypothetical protein